MLTPELLLQVEPAPVTVTVPCADASKADVGGDGGVIDDPPTVRYRKRARAKAADVERAASVVPNGAGSSHRHAASRAGQKSDGDAATAVQRTAVLDGQRARGRTADHEVSLVVHVEPAPDHRHGADPAQRIAKKPAASGQRAAVLDYERSCPDLTDGEISEAADHRTAIIDGKHARARIADHERSEIRPSGARSRHRHRAIRARQRTNSSG